MKCNLGPRTEVYEGLGNPWSLALRRPTSTAAISLESQLVLLLSNASRCCCWTSEIWVVKRQELGKVVQLWQSLPLCPLSPVRPLR